MKKIEANIVFPAPDNLDRLAKLFRKNGGFRHLVRFRLASEAAAEQCDMASHILFLDAEHAGDGLLHGLRILRRSPGQNFSVAILGDGDWRLHGNVRQMRSVVLGLDRFSALGKYGIHIADVADNFTRLPRSGFERLAERRGVVHRMGTAVPIDLQALASLERRVRVVGNHGDASQRLEHVRRLESLDGQRLLNTGHFECGLVVVRLDLLSKHGRMLNRRVDHARHSRVHAENRFAGNDLGKIEQRIAFFADVAPLGTRFKWDVFFFRDRQLRCSGSNFAIAQLTAAGAMHNEVGLGRAVFRGNAPLRGCGADQHDASGSAYLAHQVERTADRVRPVRILLAVFRIANCLLELDLRPVRIKFVGDHERQSCAAAATHLRAMGDDSDNAIRCDRHPQTGFKRRGRFAFRGP